MREVLVPKAETVVRGAAIGCALGVAYMRLLRPWQLGWGATEEECGRPLPGDDLVANPTLVATRAITIRAHPGDIWPWFAQIGVNWAAWYSYDWLDNLGRPSAREIIPELLDIKVGEVMPMSPDGKHGIPVHDLDPPRSMVCATPGDTSWPGSSILNPTAARGHADPSPVPVARPPSPSPYCWSSQTSG